LAALPDGRGPNATTRAAKFSAAAPLKLLAVALCGNAARGNSDIKTNTARTETRGRIMHYQSKPGKRSVRPTTMKKK
jgi:hypothetical protein